MIPRRRQTLLSPVAPLLVRCGRTRRSRQGADILRLTKIMETFNYDSAHWHRLRDRVMRRDNYQCQLSKRYGKIRQAELVHHIFPAADYPEYAYCSWNLISLSRDMHNKLHNRVTDELTNMGKDLLRQTARKRGIEI